MISTRARTSTGIGKTPHRPKQSQYGRCLVASALCYLVPPVLAAHAGRDETPWVGLLLANACVSLATQVTFASFNVMLKNCVAPQHVGAAIGYGSAAGTCGFALGPLWGGSLFAASSAPGALGVLGKGRMFFIVLATLAAANSQLARPRVPRPRHAVDARHLRTGFLAAAVARGQEPLALPAPLPVFFITGPQLERDASVLICL